ncbi:hypothetical protein G6F46_010770 [Rhizopus delemar]|nr:hypothetical protein G6F43_003146 [Rhizopus delemar]KAG1536674.1 hypothetical protein G6F51_010829 [Rhizopus arrhizus]KAG1492314.1 hypothetical protein G6F54_009400 [Rhizopus delemar]KAG1503733.1 hypothetical protein G6F53_010560 [Rhizopus delemar]KAG1544986.1 hypothetical protein G6F49_010930 [Rhizopus delemar]
MYHLTGSTPSVPIKDHQVKWNYPINTMTKLAIDKHQMLNDCELKLEVYQKGGKEIGSLSINLSEYAGSGVVTERYLLQDCKFNSTIKLTLRMNTKSDVYPQFQTPPLTRKQVFKDISTVVRERTERSINIENSNHALLKKSHSVMSLPKYCKIQNNTIDEPSPVDLVEQLFAPKIQVQNCQGFMTVEVSKWMPKKREPGYQIEHEAQQNRLETQPYHQLPRKKPSDVDTNRNGEEQHEDTMDESNRTPFLGLIANRCEAVCEYQLVSWNLGYLTYLRYHHYILVQLLLPAAGFGRHLSQTKRTRYSKDPIITKCRARNVFTN